MEKLLESNRTLDKIVGTIGDLPASPAIVAQLMNLTSDINTNIERVCQAISVDQSMTARILKISNSTFYGRSKEVGSLKEAVILLGFKTLRSMVLAASTRSLYDGSDTRISEALWEHSLATALAGRIIARSVKHPYVEEAFICGLMHDIGKLVLIQKIPAQYGRLIEIVERDQAVFIELEDQMLGFNHTDVGILLLHKWSFPQLLSETVFEHHLPKPSENENDSTPLSYVVNLANQMAKGVDVGFNDARETDLAVLPAANILGLDTERLGNLQLELAETFELERGAFKL